MVDEEKLIFITSISITTEESSDALLALFVSASCRLLAFADDLLAHKLIVEEPSLVGVLDAISSELKQQLLCGMACEFNLLCCDCAALAM